MSTNSSAASSGHSRRGLLGRKVGMTQVWDDNNQVVPITVVEASTNVITQIRTQETDGYTAIQIGFGQIDGRKVNKPDQGQFDKAGVTPRRHVAEIRTTAIDGYELGQEIGVDTFAAGDLVDVSGAVKGKGFAGTMKRHGFAGVSASHGQHRNHRKPGSIGGAATPGRVFKGKPMAGNMGNDVQTKRNLQVHDIDTEKGLVLLKGAVPGSRGSVVVIRSGLNATAGADAAAKGA